MNSTRQLTFSASVAPFIGGCAVGLLVLLALRIWYYELMGYTPNMHPGIAFFMLPILMAVLLAVALPLEALLQRFTFSPQTKVQAVLLGAVSTTLLTWWAFPDHWYAMAIANPLALRWVASYVFRTWPNKTIEPTR